jgi:aspartate-semialdehyde dehydrogenase
MVGSVLMERMRAEGDLDRVAARYFSTSQAGQAGPDGLPLGNAFDLDALASCDIIITCQGSAHTGEMHPKLRAAGWDGYWIDAASTLRMADNSTIVLDPVNRTLIDRALDAGCRDLIGGNCTVSLLLMGIGALFEQGWVEWLNSSTYQSASGAGAANMQELVRQMGQLGSVADPATAALELERGITNRMREADYPTEQFGAPLAASLIPWIDAAMPNGQTREEWKGESETNKILGTTEPIPVDGLCVRVGSLRCHSQAFTIKLNRDIPLEEIEAAIADYSEWTDLVPNEKAETLAGLTPANVTGTLQVPVGRVRKMQMGPEYLAAFSVGDQLLWGAAEPLRRMLRILVD